MQGDFHGPAIPEVTLDHSKDATTVASGDDLLDTTFGTGGKVRTGLRDSAYNSGRSVAFQRDGRAVFTGFSHSAEIRRFVVSRSTLNGRRDTSFGVNGTAIVTFDGAKSARGAAVLVQPDGRILAAGSSIGVSTNIAEFAVVRLLSNGQLDADFGENGRAPIPSIPGRTNEFATLALQSDGKILAAGRSFHLSQPDVCAIARVNQDGTPDVAFGSGGVLTFEGSFASSGDFVAGLVVQRDGRILAVIRSSSSDEFVVVRVLPGGVLDDTFGVGGRLIVDLPGFSEMAFDIAIRPDDRFVVTGSMQSIVNPGVDGFVAQFDPDGAFDETFGVAGVARIDRASYQTPISVEIDGVGRILVGGVGGIVDSGFNFAARLTAQGFLDSTYGVEGISAIPIAEHDAVYGFALHPSGYSITCGDTGGLSSVDTHLVRRTPSGAFDSAFDRDGQAAIDIFTPGDDAVSRVISLPDGRTLAFGRTQGTSSDPDVSIVRYLADGTVDSQFGEEGRLSLRSSPIRSRQDMAVQSDGKILVCGMSFQNDVGYLAQVERYSENGSRDIRFGNAGLATVRLGDACCGDARSMTVAPDGRILVAGHRFSTDTGTTDDYVFLLTESGRFDRSFGNGGVVTFLGLNDETFTMVAVQSDGSVVACGPGFVFGPVGPVIFVMRLRPNGRPDAGFGVNGVSYLEMPVDSFGIGAVLVQPDGRPVISGGIYRAGGGGFDAFLLRIGTNGLPDPTFGSSGLATYALGENSSANSVRCLADGRFVFAGSVDSQALVARTTPTGALDSTFGSNGIVVVDYGTDTYAGFADVSIQPTDGKIVAAGLSSSYSDGLDFVLARLLNP